MGRRHTELFLEVLRGEAFARPNPNPMFPNPPGLLASSRIRRACANELAGCRHQRHRGVGGQARDEPAKLDTQDRRERTPVSRPAGGADPDFRAAWKEAGHTREPRVSVSRSIFALVDDRIRADSGRGDQSEDQIGFLGGNERAIFGRSYAAEPDIFVEQLKTTKPSPTSTRRR